MNRITKYIGEAIYWLGWPFFWVYFLVGKRTRVLLVRGDSVLVVASWLSNGKWGLPGGGLHRGEDPAQGALRELKEEVGITLPVAALQPLGTEQHRYHGYRYMYYQFVAELADYPQITRQRHEISDAQWIDFRSLDSHNSRPEVLLTISKWRNTRD